MKRFILYTLRDPWVRLGFALGLLIGLTVLLSACATANYEPAHGQTDEEAAGARLDCKMIAEGMTPMPATGFAASGSPQFVGGAAGGYAIGLAIASTIRGHHRAELYDDCMVAHGFRKTAT